MTNVKMPLPTNSFKRAIKKREMQYGLWSTLSSNISVELVGDSGFDWILIDTEHSPTELPCLLSQLQALATGPTTPIVRPAWNDPVLIKRILDVGAQTLLVPFVQNAEEAANAVSAIRYPPRGVRGVTGSGRASRYGRVPGYAGNAEVELCLLVQIETATALGALEEIATVEGVDGVFIGPADLAASMGHVGNPKHVTVQAAIEDAGRCLRDEGIPAGILTLNEDEARRYIDWGFNFVAVGIDAVLLRDASDGLARRFKN